MLGFRVSDLGSSKDCKMNALRLPVYQGAQKVICRWVKGSLVYTLLYGGLFPKPRLLSSKLLSHLRISLKYISLI